MQVGLVLDEADLAGIFIYKRYQYMEYSWFWSKGCHQPNFNAG